MKTFCSKCGQEYEYAIRDQGKQIPCKCGELIIVPFIENSLLFPCPDCTNPVSKNAICCPKCGKPINIQKLSKEVFVRSFDIPLIEFIKIVLALFIAIAISSFIVSIIVSIIVVSWIRAL